MLVNFCIINTQRGQILICGCKVLCLFQQVFACGKVKGNITKRQKTSAFKYFLLPRYSKNEMHSEIECPVKEWFIWTKFNQNHESFASLFYMLFRMHDKDKDFSCITVYNCIFLSFLWNIKPYNIWYWCSKHKNLFQNIRKSISTYSDQSTPPPRKSSFVRMKVPKWNKSYLACLKDKVERVNPR